MGQLDGLIPQLSTPWLFLLLVASIAVLGKSADWLVRAAVVLSRKSGLPKVIVGATVVSLGTTTPEAAVSVFAALRGNPGLALGNAVGSVICDTGLILGLSSLLGRLPLQQKILSRQGWIQLGSGVLLVLACFPWFASGELFREGGRLSQLMGIVFLVLLGVYLRQSIVWVRREQDRSAVEELEGVPDVSLPLILSRLVGAVILVVVSSHFLIAAATETAQRFGVPASVIAATLVAFGTSLPELVTAITAVRRQHGDLALGNVIGADILNVLFVAGAAASVTPGGLQAGPIFFTLLFPAMLSLLVTFRLGIFFSHQTFKRSFGLLLLLLYAVVTIWSYQYSALQVGE